jgi:hypothetical protein
MVVVIKFADKNINPDRLHDELIAASIEPEGMLWAGFDRINNRLMEPFAETRVIATATGQPDTTADPGELHFRYPVALTAPQDAALDQLLLDHDHLQLSTAQQNKDLDEQAIPALISNFQNWGSLTPAQKDNNHRQLTRLVGRLLDSSQDV